MSAVRPILCDMASADLSLAPADLGRMRLVAQGLIEPLPTAVDAVRHLVCAQGQDHPGAMTSIALRTPDRTVEHLRQAYDEGLIVRSWPMRGTLFVVAAEDLDWIRALTAQRLLTGTERRRAELGLEDAVLGRAEILAREALADQGRTRAELLERWTAAGIEVTGGRGYHLLFHLALRGIICQGPMAGPSGAEQLFVLTESWIRTSRGVERSEGVRELLFRYLVARGPATLEDFCWWSKLGKREVGVALNELAEATGLVRAVVGTREVWMAEDLPDRYADLRRATAKPLLLPGFDEMVLGYQDRSAVLTREEEARVVPGGNGVFKGTVLHRGHAVGTWRRSTRKGQPVSVEPFAADGVLPPAVQTALPRLTQGLPG